MNERLLYTIGYEKALLKDVVATLAAVGVSSLIDVRDRPISRRPGFSKRQLAAAVEEAGVRYIHLQALGTPPEGRLANRRREWDRFWGIVDEKLARPEAELALLEAAEIARAAATASPRSTNKSIKRSWMSRTCACSSGVRLGSTGCVIACTPARV